MSAEELLFDAVYNGDAVEAESILRDNPTIDVNLPQTSFERNTPLHLACYLGHPAIVSLLLAHPGIDLDTQNRYGKRPVRCALTNERIPCLGLMLKDHRVKDINEHDNDGAPPLKEAAMYGRLEVIRWLIASGRDLDWGTPGDDKTCAVTAARKGVASAERSKEVYSLLMAYKANPDQVRYEVRVMLGLVDEVAAEVFAVVVFVSDGLLGIYQGGGGGLAPSPATKFFMVAGRLPMELQMVLCHRVAGSSKSNIPGKNSEAAFKHLASVFLH